MHLGRAASGVERFLRRENRVSVSFGGGGGIAREKVCGCPLIHVEQGRRTCIASPSLYPTSPLNILTRRVRGCRPIGLALPPRAPRVDTRENQELLKPRQKCQQRFFGLAPSANVVRGGAPCERRRVSCTGELHWRCPSASPLGPRGGIRSPPAGRASGAAAERGLRHLRRRRRRRRRRRPPRRTRPRRLLGR